jgi:hypothetical protein
MAASLLRRGQWRRGWAEYEWRFRATFDPAYLPDPGTPRWDGSPNAAGTLLILTEQGLGDTIQFARFIPAAARRFGGRVCIACDANLRPLLETLGPEVRVVAPKASTFPPHEVHVPLLSLPHLLAAEEVGMDRSYFQIDPQRADRWSALLREHPHPRVGIAWAGASNDAHALRRSIEPAELSPLKEVAGVSWVSLQRETAVVPFSASSTIRRPAELKDMADTAALISQLDLVLTIDTSVAHLAGALGQQVWTMLTHSPDWRWLGARDDSPWYPTMRLFRQPQWNDWNAVIARVARSLGEWVATR